jgi:hypothetical protein
MLGLLSLVGPKPPPPTPPTTVLTPEEHARLVAEVVSARPPTPDAAPVAQEYAEYLSLPNMTKLPLLTGFLSYSQKVDGGPNHKVDRRGVLIVEGELKSAFMLVHVSRPLEPWDAVYVTVDEKGGHLIGSQGLRVPPDATSTTYLFDMKRVPHNRSGEPDSPSDWFDLLHPGNRPVVHSFLSSFKPGAIDLSIFYACASQAPCSVKYEPIP